MKTFWDERYKAKEYAYGEEPNRFMVDELSKLTPGKILFPGEGEGRNAVYAAGKNWQVSAFDISVEGRKKALQLANKHRVSIDYQISDYDSVAFPPDYFDCIVMIFAHIHKSKRTAIHRKLANYLKPGGLFLMECFTKDQLAYNTGGPKNVDMLYTEDELRHDFSSFSQLRTYKTIEELDEGRFHQGDASLLRMIGVK